MEQTMTELVNRALKSDMDAQTSLYMQTKNKAYYLALQLLKNPHDVEDVLQDAYITAFTRLNTLDNPEKFQGWLDKIVINRAKDVLKKKKPMAFAELQSADGKDYVPQEEEGRIEFLPQENMDYQETKRLVQEIIDELPETQRMAVMLYYYKEMSVGQIAGYFECSTGTIKSRLNYARKAIKNKVEEFEKKGTKLYSIPVLPFLYWMFKSEAEKAVCNASNILQNIMESTTSHQIVEETLRTVSDSVTKEVARNGAKKLFTGKAAEISVGVKVGIAAIVATVGITGGILIYRMVNPQATETETTNIAQDVDTPREETVKDNVIVTPTLSPTVAPTEAVVEDKVFTLDGEWNRTNVNRGEGGIMEITNSNEEGFDFTISVSCGGNVGDADGHATMKNESDAIGLIDLYNGTYATFNFRITEDKVEIETENAEFLGGMGTYFGGTFIKEKPTYLNEDIVEETLGVSKENIINLLGEDYETLTVVMKEGTSYETDLTYSGFISGVGEGADLWIKEDGKMYCLLYEAPGRFRFYTNDEVYKNKVPEEFGQLRDEDITFIFNETIK